MRTYTNSVLVSLMTLLLTSSLVSAQEDVPPLPEDALQEDTLQGDTLQKATLQGDATVPRRTSSPSSRPAFSQQELDQMLAPIALYPDALLSQILMASTYPLEVVEAARWSKANPQLKGEEAVQAVQQNNWDTSVKSLVAFPQVLAMMDEKLNWTERLGDAFLAQQQQVMDSVQNLRQKAYSAGNLTSNDRMHVDQQGQNIVVQPANPQVVYVPYYDPMTMYGPWWWPAYPPVFWAPWPGYFFRPGFGFGFAWGFGIPLGPRFFFGGFNWPGRVVNVTVNNFYARNTVVGAWQHDAIHRRGVPYRDLGLRQQFGRMSASPERRLDFRGHDFSSPGGRSGFMTRSDVRGGTRQFSGQGGSFGQSSAPMSRPSDARALNRQTLPGNSSSFGGARMDSRPHAFEGVGRGPDVRNFSSRGNESFRGFSPPSSGGFPSGGGGFRGGGGGGSFHGGGGGGFRGGGGHRR